ncbi:MAG: hypothetical protein A0129_07460 [Limnobacter sp. CACIAM 66H1]|uniref:hypothetical protein n=1 Tax=Limnobacter sp. CACIAM 66H1 TaxID=1813033 RepID=UPI0007A8B57D|nr:hypothetical protein [Limnobacter sp. CACIAM 66H1]KYP11474.1 MAG: hypothetical protein A0129_07460 [Limnobacter sp. CACIAM 66H1]
MQTMNLDDKKLAIVGFEYVGLPLAVAFGSQRPVIDFDINQSRIDELRCGQDHTLECDPADLAKAVHLLTRQM